ncbi:hypothetical protein DXG01_013572 [Tephrocybe rancida]|nr:hypothetical protein DXG01_013572 [Tephrocybe rancida]
MSHGLLDQGRACLVFEESEANDTYGAAIDSLAQVGKGKVVESLAKQVGDDAGGM